MSQRHPPRSPAEIDIEHAIADLRHLYAQMLRPTWSTEHAAEAAQGLLGPAIAKLESAQLLRRGRDERPLLYLLLDEIRTVRRCRATAIEGGAEKTPAGRTLLAKGDALLRKATVRARAKRPVTTAATKVTTTLLTDAAAFYDEATERRTLLTEEEWRARKRRK